MASMGTFLSAVFLLFVCAANVWAANPSRRLGYEKDALSLGLVERTPNKVLTSRFPQGWRQDLLDAADKGDIGTVEDLIEEGVDVDTRDQELMTPLMLAASGGYLDIVQSLIAAGADVNAEAVSGYTVIMFACFGTVDVVNALIDAGADVNKSGEPDSDAVYIAAALNKLDIVDALVAAGGEVPSKTRFA